jgi:hypothetical protein
MRERFPAYRVRRRPVLHEARFPKVDPLIPAIIDRRLQPEGLETRRDIRRSQIVPARAGHPPFEQVVGQESDV